MSLSFRKWEGLGNDFIFLEGAPDERSPELARLLCARRSGIGADGLVYVSPDLGKLRMVIFNADGSRAAMCGNALRCIGAWWQAEGRLELEQVLEIATDSGPRRLRVDRPGWVEVDMGSPGPVSGCPHVLPLPEIGLPGNFVSMGNPHLVVLCPEGLPAEADFLRWGEAWQSAAFSPAGGINVEFVARAGLPDGGDRLQVLVWERGAGPTRACGTGACAALVSAVRVGWVQGPTRVDLPGGTLQIHWDGQGSVFMAGPARQTFRGEIDHVQT